MTIFSRILLWVPSTWVECYVRGVKKSLRRSIALLGQWSSASSSSSLVILLFPPFLVIILLALTCQNNWTRRGKTHFSYLMVSDVMWYFTRPAITHGCRFHEILHKNQKSHVLYLLNLSFLSFCFVWLVVFLFCCLLSCCLFVFLLFFFFFLSGPHSDKMSKRSQVSKVTLCVEILQWQSVTESLTDWPRSGIELPGQLKSVPRDATTSKKCTQYKIQK